MKGKVKTFLGLDLGAGSGRAVLGFLDRKGLRIREIHRFVNEPVRLGDRLYWNFLSLWSNVIESLRICGRAGITQLDGIGVDTWGVDFGWIDQAGRLTGNPVHYRDESARGIEKEIARKIPRRAFYELTGQPISRVSTLAQLAARGWVEPSHTLLMMPDLFRYFLGGEAACEKTAASTSLLTEIRTGNWSSRIFQTFQLPKARMPRMIEPGTRAGKLRAEVSRETGIKTAPVIAVAGHDTASAAAAVPFMDADTAFISCGTWALLGTVVDRPVINTTAARTAFCHLLGVDSILLIKGLAGLHLIEILRRAWSRDGKDASYSSLAREANAAKPFRWFLDPESPVFFEERDPETAVINYFLSTKQKGRPSRGEIIRAILEGLAFNFRQGLKELERITGNRLRRLCLVGGGSRNTVLCRMAAGATGLEVIAGPAEATVIGNLATQALAIGELQTAGDIRELVQRSFPLRRYTPAGSIEWERASVRYREVTGS